MALFKDNKGGIHAPNTSDIDAKEFKKILEDRHPELKPFTPVTAAQADAILNPPKTQAQIDAERNAQADYELNVPGLKVVIEALLVMIQDGAVANATVADVMAAAKAKRVTQLKTPVA